MGTARRLCRPHSSLLERFGEAHADFVLYGHTHHQLVRRPRKVLVDKLGFDLQQRDGGNGRQLSCAVLDTVTEEVVLSDSRMSRSSPLGSFRGATWIPRTKPGHDG
jgi:predicted phosphodiesterase